MPFLYRDDHAGMPPRAATLAGLPPALRWAWITVVVLGLCSVLYCLAGHLFRGYDFAHLVPLSAAPDRFGDFTVFWHKFDFFHTPDFFTQGFPFSYPAPVAVAYEFFLRHAGPHPLVAFVAFSVAALLLPAIWFGVALSRGHLSRTTAWLFVATLLLFSWPGILVIDRGNMEILVWAALAAACWAYSTGRSNAAAVLFGFAAALKLFPFVFLGLFLSTREWKKLLLGAATFVVVSVVALAILGPTIPAAYAGISGGLLFFRNFYMAHWRYRENGVDHSLFALIKAICVRLAHTSEVFDSSLSLYLATTAIVGLLLYAFLIRRLPLINQLLIFCIVSIFFTAFSGDGTLLHLYYPFALLLFLALGAHRTRADVPGLRAALVLLAALFTPLSFLHMKNYFFEGQVRAVLLGCLLVVALRYRFGPPLEESRRSERSLFDSIITPLEDTGRAAAATRAAA